MTKLNATLMSILAFSSVCFGVSLMQKTMSKEINGHIKSNQVGDINLSCENLIREQQLIATANMAKQLYNKAFSLSFSGDWQSADAVSKCAAHLTNGSDHWAIEAKNLLSHLP